MLELTRRLAARLEALGEEVCEILYLQEPEACEICQLAAAGSVLPLPACAACINRLNVLVSAQELTRSLCQC